MPSHWTKEADCSSTSTTRIAKKSNTAAPMKNGFISSRITASSVRSISPTVAETDGHVEGDVQLVRRAHLASYELFDCACLARRDLEHELVVHLQQQPRLVATVTQTTLYAEHRDLDDVG